MQPVEVTLGGLGSAGGQRGQVAVELQQLPTVPASAAVAQKRAQTVVVELARDVGLDDRFETLTTSVGAQLKASSEFALIERSLRKLRKRMFRAVPSLHSSTPEISRVDIPWK